MKAVKNTQLIYKKALQQTRNSLINKTSLKKLFNHHIKNEKRGKTYDNRMATYGNIENKLKSVTQTNFTLSNDTRVEGKTYYPIFERCKF